MHPPDEEARISVPTTDLNLWLDARADVYQPIDCSQPLTASAIVSLVQVCDRIERNDGECVVVLHVTGEPALGDQGNQWPGAQASIQQVSSWERTLRRLERLPAAIIGVAEGSCTGPALEILLATDYRIATPDLTLKLPVSNGQVWPGMALHRLATQVGVAKARQLVLFGRNVPVDVAVRIGLIDEVVTDLAEAVAFATNVVSGFEGSELAIRRRLLLDATTTSFEESLGAHLAACDRMMRRSADSD
jgi:isomerase DpgB